MDKRRLLILADYLDTVVKPETFDMGHWSDRKSMNECGATGCAIGHATRIPEFSSEGFKLVRDLLNRHDYVPIYRGLRAQAAVETFFGLTSKEAEMLFMPWYYDSNERNDPACVARRIRGMVGT